MKMVSISMDTINEIAYHAYKDISREYASAFFKSRSGKDLPGIWPKMFLYQDMTWNVGYEPTQQKVIAEIVAAEFSTRQLIEALLVELEGKYEITQPVVVEDPKNAVGKKPKGKRAKEKEAVLHSVRVPGAAGGEDEPHLARSGEHHGHGDVQSLPGHPEAS